MNANARSSGRDQSNLGRARRFRPQPVVELPELDEAAAEPESADPEPERADPEPTCPPPPEPSPRIWIFGYDVPWENRQYM